MFDSASAFDQDISAWSVENVRDMHQMFGSASSFNQDIGGWRVEQVTDMHYMFSWASAFDQDLGWCVDVGVSLLNAFSHTPCEAPCCEATSCGVVQLDNCTGYVPPTPVVDAALSLIHI